MHPEGHSSFHSSFDELDVTNSSNNCSTLKRSLSDNNIMITTKEKVLLSSSLSCDNIYYLEGPMCIDIHVRRLESLKQNDIFKIDLKDEPTARNQRKGIFRGLAEHKRFGNIFQLNGEHVHIQERCNSLLKRLSNDRERNCERNRCRNNCDPNMIQKIFIRNQNKNTIEPKKEPNGSPLNGMLRHSSERFQRIPSFDLRPTQSLFRLPSKNDNEFSSSSKSVENDFDLDENLSITISYSEYTSACSSSKSMDPDASNDVPEKNFVKKILDHRNRRRERDLELNLLLE